MKKFLKILPRKRYIHIVVALEQVLDLKTTSFEDIVGRLKAYEERINEEEEDHHESQSKLMYASMDLSQNYKPNYEGSRGRGRGGRFPWRGRGRGRGRDREREKLVTCYRCDKQAHYTSDCPDRLLKLQETMEGKDEDTQEADKLMMHEVIFLNEEKVKPKCLKHI